MILPHATLYDNQNVAGCYISEKLIGRHVFWDGGISRGCAVRDVPYAAQIVSGEISTGCWDKRGKPIKLTDALLNEFPCIPLEGVIVEGEFAAFGCPPIDAVHPQFEKWLHNRPNSILKHFQFLRNSTIPITFEQELAVLRLAIYSSGPVYLHFQLRLPTDEVAARCILHKAALRHSMILRNPQSRWQASESLGTLEVPCEK